MSMITTGLNELDRIIDGLKGGQLIMIAARPAMGKTTFAMNVVENVCIKEDKGVLFFSGKMSREKFTKRFLELRSGIAPGKNNQGIIDDEKLVFVEICSLEIKHIKQYLEKNEKLSLVVIDYLQIMNPSEEESFASRSKEILSILTDLKKLAEEFNISIMVLSQLSRALEGRKDHRPILTDIRESRYAAEKCDSVIFLYRDDYYHNIHRIDQEGEIIVAKHPNINGNPKTVKVKYSHETGFMNI